MIDARKRCQILLYDTHTDERSIEAESRLGAHTTWVRSVGTHIVEIIELELVIGWHAEALPDSPTLSNLMIGLRDRKELMSEGLTEEKGPKAPTREKAVNVAEPGVTDREGKPPRGVKRAANEDWPTGGDASQGVVVNSEEVAAVEVAKEDQVDVHPFWGLLQ